MLVLALLLVAPAAALAQSTTEPPTTAATTTTFATIVPTLPPFTTAPVPTRPTTTIPTTLTTTAPPATEPPPPEPDPEPAPAPRPTPTSPRATAPPSTEPPPVEPPPSVAPPPAGPAPTTTALPPGVGMVSDKVASEPGGVVTLTGGGCTPNAPVTVSIGDRVIGSIPGTRDGKFIAIVNLPQLIEVGRYDVRIACGVVHALPLDIVVASHFDSGNSVLALGVFLVLAAFALYHQLRRCDSRTNVSLSRCRCRGPCGRATAA